MKNKNIKVFCIGDIAPVRQAGEFISEKKFFLSDFFLQTFLDADLVFCNLESPVTKLEIQREDKKFNLKSDPNSFKSLPENIIFSLGNNHIMDYGSGGLLDTINFLKNTRVRFTGAGANIEEAGKPVVLNIKNRTIGFIAAADKRYQAATHDSPGIFPADVTLLIPKIKELKKQADIIYLSIHMGMEYIPVPTPAMKEIAKLSHEAEADVIFFHHAHCLSGVTLNDNKATLWGLGNFIFPEKENYPFKPWFETAAFHFTHLDQTDELSLEIVPYKINDVGFPERPDSETEEKILTRIKKLSNQINSGKSLEKLRWKNFLTAGYLRVALSNYADIARRQGVLHVFRQMISSIKVLFLKK